MIAFRLPPEETAFHDSATSNLPPHLLPHCSSISEGSLNADLDDRRGRIFDERVHVEIVRAPQKRRVIGREIWVTIGRLEDERVTDARRCKHARATADESLAARSGR